MGKKLLNENCKFRCTGNFSILIQARDDGNTTGRDSRKKLLTSSAECLAVVPLECHFQPVGEVFLPCQLSALSWQNTEPGITINGRPVLTERSYTDCAFGGMITPVSSACKTSVGAYVDIVDLDMGSFAGKSMLNTDMETSDKEPYSGNKFDGVPDGERDDALDDAFDHTLDHTPYTPYASYTLCGYENCEKREECEYFKTQIYVENDSARLSSNYKSERAAEWQAYDRKHVEKNRESVEGNWRIAAHHLISGNQVLMTRDRQGTLVYGGIVKLANYFGYDINGAVNGIMLPTNEGNFGERERIAKAANAYEVMWLMGRQWHAGGHQYSISKDTLLNLVRYYKKYPEQYPAPGNPDFFVNYKMAVKEEMDKLLLKYSRPRCWEKNRERRKEKFIFDLNHVSKNIESCLLRFEQNPKASFPFFVSRAAVEYAFDLPSSKKIVVLYKDSKEQIRAKRVRMERYRKNDLRIIPNEKGDMAVGESESQREELIRFCENTMHFLIQEGIGWSLPFTGGEEDCFFTRSAVFGEESVISYLTKHSNEVMAFLQQGEYGYQPINKTVEKRLKEANSI